MALWKKQKRASGGVPELGAIFMCNRATKKVCFTWKTFGLPIGKAGFVRQVKAGMFLFLFEYETRKLYGVYQASGDGAVNISADAFSSTGNKYPAQVHFRVLWYCKPLSEDEFRPAIKDNYFAAYKFNFGLTKNQVMELLWLFNTKKIRDELPLEHMVPSDPSLSRGTTREEFSFKAQSEYLPENASDLELDKNLENLLMPNREVHGRLLIDGDKDIVREDTGIVQDRELPHRDRVNQDYGYNSNNDYDLNSGVLCVSADEKYDPDIPLFEDMPTTQQLQRYHEENGHMWDERVYADNSADGRSLIEEDHVQNFTRYFQPISNSRSPRPVYFDNAVSEGLNSYNPDSGTCLQGCGRYSGVHLNPDFFRVSNNSINVEPLKPLSENMALPSETDNASILRQSLAYNDPSQTVTRPNNSGHFQSGVGIKSFAPDNYEGAHDWETIVPSFCVKDSSNPIDIIQDSKVCRERQPVSQKKRSVFSRLKPAVDAGDASESKDSRRSVDDMVNEVMDTLKGHYCQLVKEFSSTTKQVDDDDNKSKTASVEMLFDLSAANEEFDSQIIEEMPLLNFKRRSEVQKTRNTVDGGLGETSSANLADKQSKRRKLVRPTFGDKKLSNDDTALDKISVKFTLSCQSFQDESFNTDVPLPCDKTQNSPEAGNLGSGSLLAASVGDECSSGLTGSNNLTVGSADIGVGSDCGKGEKDERVKTSTKLELGGSLKDGADFCVEGRNLQLVSVTEAADNRSDCGKGEKDERVKTSTKLDLGGSLNDGADFCVEGRNLQLVSVTEAADNRSDKSFGSEGSPQELPNDLDMVMTCFVPVKNDDTKDPIMGQIEVHEESKSISSLAEVPSANGQATQVRYFEFFK